MSRWVIGAGPSFTLDAVATTAELEYGQRIVFLRRSGFDEDDAIGGMNRSSCRTNGSLEIELSSADRDGATSPPTANLLLQRPASAPTLG